jgi:hypothetical protein
MADDDTRLGSGVTEPPQPPAVGPDRHPAHDAAPDPDSVAQPGQALAHNTTIAPATTTTSTKPPPAPGLGMPLNSDDATIAPDPASVVRRGHTAGRHQEAPHSIASPGDTTAPSEAAQEPTIGQPSQDIRTEPLFPIDTDNVQSSGGASARAPPPQPPGLETKAQAETRPMPDPSAALHHQPPEPATDAALPPAPAPPADDLPVPRFVAPSSYLRPKTSQRSGHPPTAAMASQEHRPPPGPYDKEQLQGLVSFICPSCPGPAS